MPNAWLSRAGAVAAVLGGALWLVKGGVILLGGNQPDLIFELAQLGFALGLVGLHARLAGRGGRLATIGVLVASATAAASVINMLGVGFAAPATALGWMSGSVLLGLAALQATVLPRPWRGLPLIIGLGLPVLLGLAMLVVFALSPLINPDTVEERAIEVPIVLLGFAWATLGYLLFADPAPSLAAPGRAPPPSAPDLP